MLVAASVLGVQIDRTALDEVVGRAVDTLAALDRLCAAGFILERSVGAYAFNHALIRDAVYASASRSRRKARDHELGLTSCGRR